VVPGTGKIQYPRECRRPGFIATEMVQKMPEKVIQFHGFAYASGANGNPEDVAEAYLWLASDAASFHYRHGAFRRWRIGAGDLNDISGVQS